MAEYITVFTLIFILVSGWIALCINHGGVKEGIKIAVFVPTVIIVIVGIFVWVGYSINFVLN